MERLTEDDRTRVQKASNERITLQLVKLGETIEDLKKMTRQELQEKWAAYILGDLIARKPNGDKIEKAAAVSAQPVAYDVELEKRRLQLLEQQLAEQIEQRTLKERELEEQRTLKEKEMEQQHKIQAMQYELKDRELRLKEMELKVKMDHELKLASLHEEAEDRRHKEMRETKESTVNLQKNFGAALKASIGNMPESPEDINLYLRDFERQLDYLKVPNELRASLLRPFLNKRGRLLVQRMDNETSLDYKKMTESLLKELKLTPKAYWDKFLTTDRRDDESYVLFVNRLNSIIESYFECRGVNGADECEQCAGRKSLLLADRVKALIEGTHIGRQIHSIESQKSDQNWLRHRELAEAIDSYLAGRTMKEKSFERNGNGESKNRERKWKNGNFRNKSKDRKERTEFATLEASGSKVEKEESKEKTEPKRSNQCFKCKRVGCRSYYHNDDGSLKERYKQLRSVRTVAIQGGPKTVRFVDEHSATLEKTQKEQNGERRTVENEQNENVELILTPEPMEYLEVKLSTDVNGEGVKVKILRDSGAEICLIREDVLTENELEVEARHDVGIRGIIGQPIRAKVGFVYMRLPNVQKAIPVPCAISKLFNQEILVPSSVVSRLFEQELTESQDTWVKDMDEDPDCFDGTDDSQECTERPINDRKISLEIAEADDTLLTDNASEQRELNESYVLRSDSTYEVERVQTRSMSGPVEASDPHSEGNDLNVSTISDMEDIEQRKATAGQLIKEQQEDDSFYTWQKLATLGKGDFILDDGLLYKQVDIHGHPVRQLCLPTSRRKLAFKLAHSTSHLGTDKVYQRLRLTFA